MENDIARANGFSILVARDDDSNLIANWKVIALFVANAVEPYREVCGSILLQEFMCVTVDGGIGM
jgi:hypothetical protein